LSSSTEASRMRSENLRDCTLERALGGCEQVRSCSRSNSTSPTRSRPGIGAGRFLSSRANQTARP
jgi:hypothetical protein